MDDLGLFLIIILIIVIVYAIISYISYPMKNRIMIDRIDTDELKKIVTDFWIVKRGFADGRFPYATNRFSHWGLLLKTEDGSYFIIAMQFNQVTEVMKAYVDSCLVFTIEQKCPWFVFNHFSPENSSTSIKDIVDWFILYYRNKDSGFFKYSCQCAVVDMVTKFSNSPIRCKTGFQACLSAFYELIHYKRTALLYNASCLLSSGNSL